MPATRTNPKPAEAAADQTAASPEVLTLAEAAAYLRVSEANVLQIIHEQHLPGRRIGQEWRFLKPAIQDWLRTPPATARKEAFLAMAGKFEEDPFLEDIVREAYRNRGRPITEDSE
jgi:excisionase family DNA binding protein